MGIAIETEIQSTQENKNDILNDLKKSYDTQNISACISYLLTLSKKHSYVKSKKSSENFFKIKKFWEYTNHLIISKATFSLPYKQIRKNKVKFKTIRTIFYDNFIEHNWKEQYEGKYGGPKDSSFSWKQWYLKNEQAVEALETLEEKLVWAIKMGHLNYFLFLQSSETFKSVSQLEFENNRSALSICIENNYAKLAKELMENKLFITKSDRFGWYSLHYAVYFGNISICKQLLQQKVPLNVREKNGLTPVHFAVIQGQIDILKIFLKKGAKVNYKDNKGLPPLYYALINRDISSCELLVNYGADIKFKDIYGHTFLHIAIKLCYASMVKFLLNVNINLDAKDKFGRTALHYAVETNNIGSIEMLLNAGIQLDSIDSLNQTPLIAAALAENTMATATINEHLLLK